MNTVRDLREQRAAAWARSQEYQERAQRGDTITTDDRTQWERSLDQFDALSAQIAIRGGGADDPAAGEQHRVDARSPGAADVVRHGPDPEEFRTFLRTGDDRQLRAIGTTVGSAGGYAVPASFWAKVTDTMKAFGGLRRLAEVITTDQGQDLPWPTNDDTANTGTILGEGTAATELDVEFGQNELGAHTYISKTVRVQRQLIQDNGFPLEAWLARKLGMRIGRAQAPHWISGTGSSQPQGAVAAATVGVTAASQTAFTYDELVDMVASVDAAYLEEDPAGIGWVMNQTSWAKVRKLKDSQNRPLVETNLQTGRPTSLLGYQVVIDNGMANATQALKPILFGNVRAGYVIRDVGTTELLRFEERYGEYLQVGFLGYQRSDGLVQDVSAYKVMQMAA